jgi:small subunit ribosomal protein S1
LVKGKVKEVQDRGLVIELTPDVDGFMPLSQVSKDKVENLEESFPVGTEIEAKIIGFDDRGRLVRLSRRVIEEEKEMEEVRQYIPQDDDKPHGSFKLGDMLEDLLNNKGE